MAEVEWVSRRTLGVGTEEDMTPVVWASEISGVFWVFNSDKEPFQGFGRGVI